jgi:hypothetical protein
MKEAVLKGIFFIPLSHLIADVECGAGCVVLRGCDP